MATRKDFGLTRCQLQDANRCWVIGDYTVAPAAEDERRQSSMADDVERIKRRLCIARDVPRPGNPTNS